MTHTHHTPLAPLYDSTCNFWYANFDGTCIAIGDTRASVQEQIDLFLGRK